MLVYNPAFLWALLLGSVPILIYLLMRYRSLKVRWGSNYVLERAIEKLKKKRYWDQILLIALRVLAIMAIAFAFARPASHAKDAGVSGVHHVVVIDTSYSLLSGQRDASRWQRGMELVGRVASTWGRSDVWSLYVLDDNPRWVVDSGVVTTPEATLATLQALEPTETSASLAKAFETLIAKFPDASDVEITVLTDDQETAWKNLDRVNVPANWSPTIYWVNPPLDDRVNLAVTRVRFSAERALVKHPVRVFVSVKNFSADPVRDAEVEILRDGAFFDKESVSLLPGQETEIHRDLVFDDDGSHYVTARVASDALDYDNVMHAGLQVEPTFRLLVLRDGAHAGKFDSSWRFLDVLHRVQEYINEFDEPVFSHGKLTLSQTDADPDPALLASADIVVLDGGRTLTPELAEQLRRYVAAGGGLLLAADQNVSKETWNDLLGSAKLLPAPLERLRTEKGGGPRFRTLARSKFEGLSLKAFDTPEEGEISNALFYVWWDTAAPTPPARILLNYDDGAPFAVQLPNELGNVLMTTAGLNGWWNNLVVREFYVPLVFRLSSEAASGGIFPRVVPLRSPVRLRLSDPETVRGVTFQPVDAESVVLQPTDTAAGRVASANEGSAKSGLVSMLTAREGGAAKRVYYGVQGERMDSDLTPMGREARRRLTEDLRAVEVADWDSFDEALQRARASREWHHWVILLALGMLVGEKLLERRFV